MQQDRIFQASNQRSATNVSPWFVRAHPYPNALQTFAPLTPPDDHHQLQHVPPTQAPQDARTRAEQIAENRSAGQRRRRERERLEREQLQTQPVSAHVDTHHSAPATHSLILPGYSD